MRLSVVLRAIVLPILALIALVVVIRQNSYPYATITLYVVILVLFVDLATLVGGTLQNACIVAAALVFGLAGLEVVGETRMPHIVRSRMNLWAPDHVLGYHAEKAGVVAAAKTVDEHLAYRVTYTIDNGLRRFTKSTGAGPKVRFFGDSFTFGEGLDDADTLPQRFADMSGANVLNYGYPGFSPAQALRALQVGLYDKDLAGASLFVLQTGPFHVERVACKPDYSRGFPRYAAVGGKLEFDGQCSPTPGQSTGIYQMLLQGLDRRITRADVETYIDVVDAFVDLAKRKYHVPVVIMDMIRGSDALRGTGVTSEQIERRFRDAGAIVVDDSVPAQPGDKLAIPYDGHPSATADNLYARKLIETIDAARPGLLAPAAQDAKAQARQ